MTQEHFTSIVKESKSIRECLRKFDWGYSGHSYTLFKKYVAEFQLDTTHFTGQRWFEGKPNALDYLSAGRTTPLEKILVNGPSWRGTTHHLKLRLLKEKIFKRKCYNCNLTEWMQKPIPIELEHINGNKYDFRLENLTLLCPNCHAQTSTYRGLNIGKFTEDK